MKNRKNYHQILCLAVLLMTILGPETKLAV